MEKLYLANNYVYLVAESFADAEKLYHEYHDEDLKKLAVVTDEIYIQDFAPIQANND